MNKYVIYGGKSCTFCARSRFLLEDYDIKHEYHDVDKEFKTRNEFFDKFASQTNNKRSIPIVFVNNTFLGGWEDLKKFVSENENQLDDDF